LPYAGEEQAFELGSLIRNRRLLRNTSKEHRTFVRERPDNLNDWHHDELRIEWDSKRNPRRQKSRWSRQKTAKPMLWTSERSASQCFCGTNKTRGAAKKKMTKVTYICRSAKKKVVTYFILFYFYFYFYRFFLKAFFGRFVTRGVQKHENKTSDRLAISRSTGKILCFKPSNTFPALQNESAPILLRQVMDGEASPWK
jgi:hypothetical protein